MNFIDRLLKREEVTVTDDIPVKERITGRIIKLRDDEGWGFISSKAIPFTRIFFHWSALNQDTLKFPELKRGMEVEFEPLEIGTKGAEDYKGYRAIRIKVLEENE